MIKTFKYGLLIPILFMSLFGCGQSHEQQAVHHAVQFESGDECHLCGMLIANFPGPKGQAYFDKKPVKFCSTKDLMAYYLDEENTHRIDAIFVHDMAESHWDKPNDEHLIDARLAWFVAGSSKQGAMGPTLATFKSQVAAEFFAKEYGGEVLGFDQVTQAVLMQTSASKTAESVSSKASKPTSEHHSAAHHHHHH